MRLLESPRVLFWVPTLIWASTWHVILYQLDGGVPAIVSVAWRFALASLLLFALAAARGIGFASAVRLAAEGAEVWITDRDEAALAAARRRDGLQQANIGSLADGDGRNGHAFIPALSCEGLVA